MILLIIVIGILIVPFSYVNYWLFQNYFEGAVITAIQKLRL
jgi:hypothetical protein